jgi:hypothetical protein
MPTKKAAKKRTKRTKKTTKPTSGVSNVTAMAPPESSVVKIRFVRRYKCPGAVFQIGDVVEVGDETSMKGKKIARRNAELAIGGGGAVLWEPSEEEA